MDLFLVLVCCFASKKLVLGVGSSHVWSCYLEGPALASKRDWSSPSSSPAAAMFWSAGRDISPQTHFSTNKMPNLDSWDLTVAVEELGLEVAGVDVLG